MNELWRVATVAGVRSPRLVRFVATLVIAMVCLASCSVTAEPGDMVLAIEVDGDPTKDLTADGEAEVDPATAIPRPTPEDVAQAQERTVEAVDDVFEEYRSALLDLDGARASRVVTQSTFAYYDRVLDAGLNATADELLNDIPLTDALGVLAMRASLGTDLQDVSDGAALFAVGVDLGLVGDNVATVQFDRIELDGDQAFGVLQGARAMRFEYVEDGWYFDLPFTTSFIDDNEDDFLRGLVGESADRAEFYDLVALGYGTTWDELSTPLG